LPYRADQDSVIRCDYFIEVIFMNNWKKNTVIGLLLALLAGVGGYLCYPMVYFQKGKIMATGTIEVTTADITPKVGGYLVELGIKEGDRIEMGQCVARIDRTDLALQVAQANGALKRAMYQLADLKKGTRPQEIEQARAKLSAAEAVYAKAQADFGRYSTLYQDGAISAQQFDAIRAGRDTAYNEVAALRQNLDLLQEGTRVDQISAQQEEVERSQYVLEASKVLLADALVTAPLTGVIISKNYENREYVNAGAPVATILDLDDCWVKIYLSSQQIGLITIGQPADVHIDSFPNRNFPGVIKEVSTRAEFTPHNTLTQHERASQVFAVKVKVNNSAGLLKPGMPADVAIRLNIGGKEAL
jgi:HlyD family secretion protein